MDSKERLKSKISSNKELLESLEEKILKLEKQKEVLSRKIKNQELALQSLELNTD